MIRVAGIRISPEKSTPEKILLTAAQKLNIRINDISD